MNKKVRVTGILKTFDFPVATQKDGAWSAGDTGSAKAYRLEKAQWERVGS